MQDDYAKVRKTMNSNGSSPIDVDVYAVGKKQKDPSGSTEVIKKVVCAVQKKIVVEAFLCLVDQRLFMEVPASDP